jgi:lipopolysaccharide export system permease protein
MEGRDKARFMPLGSILDRYLARGFVKIFFVSLLCITALYLIVDFFDRISVFLDTDTPLSTIARYFFYKAPLLVSRVVGFATLFSTLFCLGMLARTQEITAMRAGGLSLRRLALPLFLVSLVICLLSFSWNEGLVPIFEHRAQTIYKTEVKNKQQKSLFGSHDIWIRGANSFVNVDTFDAKSRALHGVTVFLLNRDFSLRGMIEIPTAHWNGKEWKNEGATEWRILADGQMAKHDAVGAPPIIETPQDFELLARDPEEFTFFDLRKLIGDMKSKGLDATAYEVDLQFKLALPVISPLMVLLAVPFAVKRHLGSGMALSFGVAMLIGFGYWVLSAFCLSLGHSGALPVGIAAWLPNAVFALIGLFFFSGEE